MEKKLWKLSYKEATLVKRCSRQGLIVTDLHNIFSSLLNVAFFDELNDAYHSYMG